MKSILGTILSISQYLLVEVIFWSFLMKWEMYLDEITAGWGSRSKLCQALLHWGVIQFPCEGNESLGFGEVYVQFPVGFLQPGNTVFVGSQAAQVRNPSVQWDPPDHRFLLLHVSVNKRRRVAFSSASLLKMAPSAEERMTIHEMFLNTLDPK